MTQKIRLHDFVPRSFVNGPGQRAAVFVQGCSLGCPGCFNSGTHSFKGGELVTVSELVNRITSISGITGVSLLGGEPLQQSKALLAFLQALRAQSSLSVILFTGYSLSEITAISNGEKIVRLVDVVIAGRYDQTKRLARGLRGSSNKTVTFVTDRYSEAHLQRVPVCEITIDHEGVTAINGMDPVVL
jgi:anaerobic ribonucleoside-triphosphate reductase activating protein